MKTRYLLLGALAGAFILWPTTTRSVVRSGFGAVRWTMVQILSSGDNADGDTRLECDRATNTCKFR